MEHGKDPRLDQIFASYGADRARWPASERSLGDEGGEAAREAHEIDQLLSLASTPAEAFVRSTYRSAASVAPLLEGLARAEGKSPDGAQS